MVTAVTNLGRSGLYDWLVQRVSGVILLLYFLCVGSYLGLNPDLTYDQWKAFFAHTSMQRRVWRGAFYLRGLGHPDRLGLSAA